MEHGGRGDSGKAHDFILKDCQVEGINSGQLKSLEFLSHGVVFLELTNKGVIFAVGLFDGRGSASCRGLQPRMERDNNGCRSGERLKFQRRHQNEKMAKGTAAKVGGDGTGVGEQLTFENGERGPCGLSH